MTPWDRLIVAGNELQASVQELADDLRESKPNPTAGDHETNLVYELDAARRAMEDADPERLARLVWDASIAGFEGMRAREACALAWKLLGQTDPQNPET